jgi:hypothetical protein
LEAREMCFERPRDANVARNKNSGYRMLNAELTTGHVTVAQKRPFGVSSR